MTEGRINRSGRKEFKRRIWITAGIVALVFILIWILKAIFNVLLLILAGALIALYFQGMSGLLQNRAGLPKKWSLPLSVVGSLLLLIGFFWLAGSKIQQQAAQLSETLPSTVQKVKEQLSHSAIGRQLLEQVNAGSTVQRTASIAQSFFRSTFGVLGDVYVVLFLSIFFTAGPRAYVSGFLKLIPPNAKPRASHVVNTVGATLTKWLKGQILAMLVVAVLTLIGLTVIGVPMALVLALIAGLLNFIPNFGPLLAMIPAVLVGLMQSPATALLVAGLYILVQVLESNLITPQIQKKLINIPPALIIISQLIMGVLTGGWGLVLATPLVAMVIVIVRELYVKELDGGE